MAVYALQMFYLGNVANMDISEGNALTENANSILGTYDSPDLQAVDAYDGENDAVIIDNEVGNIAGDYLSYDTGSGPTLQYIDSTIVYNTTVTLGDGSTTNIIATAVQTENGDVFLTDFANGGSFDNLNIQSFELTSVYGANYTGFFADSTVENTNVVCFAQGMPIETTKGVILVESLRAGMLVPTRDHGAQPIRWVGSNRHARPGQQAPVIIPPSTLAPDNPGTNPAPVATTSHSGLLTRGNTYVRHA